MTPNVLFALFYALSGTILILLGFAIYRDNPHERLNRITSLMLLWGGLGALFGALNLVLQEAFSTTNLQEFQIYREFGAAIWEFFFPQLLLFALVFPSEHHLLTRYRWLPFVIFTPHVAHFFIIFFAPQLIEFSETYLINPLENHLPGFMTTAVILVNNFTKLVLTLHKQLFSIVNLFFFLIALWLLYRSLGRIEQPHLKQQVMFIFVGILIAAGLYAALILLPVIFDFPISPLLRSIFIAIGLVVGSGSIAVAIIRYRFLDISLLLRKSAFYSFSAGLVAGIYLLVIRYFDQTIGEIFGQRVPLFEIGFFLFALVLFQPLMNWLERFMDTIFLRGGRDYRAAMQELSNEILTTLDFDELKDHVVERLSKTMMTEQVILYLKSAKNEAFFPVAWSQRLPEWHIFEMDSDFVELLYELKEPILERNLVRILPDRQTQIEVQKKLRQLGAFLIAPIQHHNKMVGFLALGQKVTQVRYGYEDMTMLAVLGNQLAVAIENIQLYQELATRERAKKEMEIAQKIQQTLLPPKNLAFPGIQLSSITLPAIEVGGDYFDFFSLSSKSVGLVIGDVAGKGVFGAVYMAMVRSLLRAHAFQHESPRETLILVNNLLRRDTERHMFVSLFYGIYSIQDQTLLYCRAGHNPPILSRANTSESVMLNGQGMALGIADESVFDKNLEEVQVKMKPGDYLLLYTDGITEAMNADQEEFGEERLTTILKNCQDCSAQDLMDRILNQVNTFVGNIAQHDDMTMIAFRIL